MNIIARNNKNMLEGFDSYKNLLTKLKICNSDSLKTSNNPYFDSKKKLVLTNSLSNKNDFKLNIAFLIDGSASLISLLDKEIEIALNLIERLETNYTKFSIIKFGGYTKSKIFLPFK